MDMVVAVVDILLNSILAQVYKINSAYIVIRLHEKAE